MSKKLVNKVAIAIKSSRKACNLSQEDLAERSSLDRTYISGVERGVRNITLESLEAIVIAFDISLNEFLQVLIDTDENQ